MINLSAYSYPLILSSTIVLSILFGIVISKFKSATQFASLCIMLGCISLLTFACYEIFYANFLFFFSPDDLANFRFPTMTSSIIFIYAFGLGLKGLTGRTFSEIIATRRFAAKILLVAYSLFLFFYLDYLILSFYFYLDLHFQNVSQPTVLKLILNAFGFYLLFDFMLRNWYSTKPAS